MVNKEFKLPGKEIVVKVSNGFYVFWDKSGTGKTYFAELVKSLIDAKLLNAKVIQNQKEYEEFIRQSKNNIPYDLVILEKSSLYLNDTEILSLSKQSDTTILSDYKVHLLQTNFAPKQVSIFLQENKIEVIE